MKAKILLSALLTFTFYLLSSQVPQGLNYQAIARGSDGKEIVNTSLQVQISILSDTTGFKATGGGTYIWEEEHSVTTNSLGLFTLVVGDPGATKIRGTGTFGDIDWKAAQLFIGTKIYYQSSWKIMGSAQLWTVPYSMLAGDLEGAVSKLEVIGDDTQSDEALFEVKRKDGETMFAVYNHGVRVFMPHDTLSKAKKGGFAIGGFDKTKGTIQDYFVVNPDSIRAYVNDNPVKTKKGGFAVGGFGTIKGDINNFLALTPNNYFIGHQAGFSNTTGKYNSFIGYKAGYSNTEGLQNSFLGYYAGYSNITGYSNIFIGDSSGYYNTTGEYNVFVGNQAGNKNTTGFQNIYLGQGAGFSNTTGNRNIIIGTAAGWENTKGFNNVFIGNYAGAANTIGNLNVVIGRTAGYSNTEGIGNTFLGQGAGLYNTTGNSNVYVGREAGKNSNGSANVFIGISAGFNEIGSNKLYIENSSNDSTGTLIYGEFDNDILHLNADVTINGELRFFSGSSNIFLGDSAGYYNTTGNINTVLGHLAGVSNNAGSRNVFLGSYAGYSNKNGNRNVFIGLSSGLSNTDGLENTSIGAAALYNNGTGNFNTVLGRSAGFSNITGTGNIFLGYKAGYNELGSDRLYIQNSDADSSNALIYGEFNNKYLKLNALTSVRDALILEPRSTAPPSPVKGMMYFDSTDNKLKVFDGTVWRSLW